MLRIAGRAIALLAVFGTAMVFALLAYVSWRDSNVSRIAVSRLSDLEEAFEVSVSSLRVKNPEFLRVCFTGDFVYALKDAREWFRADETEFKRALRAAGGRTDVFNDDEHSSIVLLSHSSALILQVDWRKGLQLANVGCASADAGDITIRRYQTNSSMEFYLPNATPKSPRGRGQPRATLCEEKLERFVESIDDLLARPVLDHRFFWAVIRKYLPADGCTASEVISASKRSRFFVPPISDMDRLVHFESADNKVFFGLEKDTGKIYQPHVVPTGLDSF